MMRLLRITLGLLALVVVFGGLLSPAHSAPETEHPRLFFTTGELPRLRAWAATTHQDIWQQITDYVDTLAATPPLLTPPRDGTEDDYRLFGNQLIPMAFVCVLTDRDDICDLTRDYLLTYAAWDQWGEGNRRDLGHAHMVLGNALAYDWLYDRLTPEERAQVRNSLVFWAGQLYEASVRPYNAEWNNWWAKAYLQNHHWINHSALGIAALVLLGDDTALASVCQVSALGQNVNLRAGPGTGYSVEQVLAAGQSVTVLSEGITGEDGFIWWHTTGDLWVRSDVVGEPQACTANVTVDAQAQQWLAQVIDQMGRVRDFLNAIGDGSWHEGIFYQNYGLTLTLPFWDSLRQVKGIDLIPHAYLQGYTYWTLYNNLPRTKWYILTYGDFEWWWGIPFPPHTILRFNAREYEDGRAEWMARRSLTYNLRPPTEYAAPWSVFEFLYYDPSIEPTPPDDLPLTRVFPDQESVIWREGWQDDATIFALKSGAYAGRFAFDSFLTGSYPWEAPCPVTNCQLSFGHDHDDTGTFYLYSQQDWLAPESAGYDRAGTAYHNMILIDGQGQQRPDNADNHSPEAFRGTDGTLTTVAAAPDFDYAAVDATQRYSQINGIERVIRHIVYVRPDVLVMVDDLAADAPHRYDWVCHFREGVVVPDEAGEWIQGVSRNGLLLGIAPLSSQAYAVETGDDGQPYLRIHPTAASSAARLVHVLYPTNEADWSQHPQAAILSETADGVVVRIQSSTTVAPVYDVIFGLTGQTGSIGPYELDGEAAAITWQPGHTWTKLFIVNGTRLVDQGRVLIGDLAVPTTLEVTQQETTINLYGDITSAVTLYSPSATDVYWNGQPWSFTRSGDYIVIENPSAGLSS